MHTLHQFVSSHFNEKVRWALAFKQIPHQRTSYLPGPHIRTIRRLSGGPSTTPLLETDGRFISGSARIIDYLETTWPELPLYPAQPAERSAALDLQARFDREVGPAIRTAVFSEFVDTPGYLAATFSSGKPRWKQAAYRAFMPIAMPLIRKANGVFPENVGKSLRSTAATLDEVAGAVQRSGYLVGDRFSIADLTAASLLAPIAAVQHPDMRRLEPMPDRLRDFLSQWQDHAAIIWVHEIYRKHRLL